MKLLLLFFIIIRSYLKHCIFFLYKLLCVMVGIFYILEYLFLFKQKNKYIHSLILYSYLKKRTFIVQKKIDVSSIFNYKVKETKKINYMNNLKNIYYYRRMYFGLAIVYMQIFFRKIKEKKNYIKYIYGAKLKTKYNKLKKTIINYSLLLYFFSNYNLVFFLENIKKRLFSLIVFLSFFELYKKAKFKNKLFLSFALIYKLYHNYIINRKNEN